ncbi:MAG: V-type ATP synthase subunit F [Victivallales bacterium]|nr:V-type ATP synthase subunit F [Victivallales bacterium]
MSVYHIIGDQDTVLGYRFAGVSGDVVETADEAEAAFRKALDDPSVTVLLITEAVEDMISEGVTRHRLAAQPPYLAVVQSVQGPIGNRKSLQELINEAVGVRISTDEEEDDKP